ncbi:hypothetical protein F5890DRAFT_1474698 [Lentinula detonsa]|uniref:DDE-1 domain-containing protein n=1 Tax=Lentinula detonsa TaxID=2804962 RepID=A0AA38PZR1_9AGAR|nr:hypothetical protein F5890DRAFT_1474698 [Lentinula detonsa]
MNITQAKKKYLPLLKIKQLLILQNFATLQLKNSRRIHANQEIALQWHEKDGVHFARRVHQLVRHYQVFRQLLDEKRGGMCTSRTLLSDEITCNATRAWLLSQKVGEVTPKKFQAALNEIILPDLGIRRKSPLCLRTARRWLIALGWHLTVLQKGVYMDGHEHPDVVKYRQEEFLLKMAEYEWRMVHYEGPELQRIPPTLHPGEKEVITEFHDESSFHALEYKASIWSNHPSKEIQRPSVFDADGKITRHAQKVIFPGANGDDWWDTKQLLVQIREAISIFEDAHPGCQALFIFDQSSTHASLGPDALRAWDMNRSDGGKQRRQRDTVIPQSNPDSQSCGQAQTMSLLDGRPKGLQ